jgi:hypothetical protein
MLIENSVIAPEFFWGSQSQFPMIFYIAKDPFIAVAEIQENEFKMYPNPVQREISLISNNLIRSIEVFNISSKVVFSQIFNQAINDIKIKMEDFEPGLYIFKIINHQNHIYYERVIKLP